MYKNYNIEEIGKLTLSSCQIDSSNINSYFYNQVINNNIGIIENSRSKYTWKNINIETIVGSDIYRKYDTFNIELVHLYFPDREAGSIGLASYDFPYGTNFQIFMSGLNWENSSFNVGNGTNRTLAPLTQYTFTNSVVPVQFYYDSYQKTSLRFKKSSKLVDLTLSIGQPIRNRTIITPAVIGEVRGVFPHIVTRFNIIPVK